MPYFFVGPDDAFRALKWSIAVMAVALFVFGYGKTCFVTGWKGRENVKGGVYGGVQMVIVGGHGVGQVVPSSGSVGQRLGVENLRFMIRMASTGM